MQSLCAGYRGAAPCWGQGATPIGGLRAASPIGSRVKRLAQGELLPCDNSYWVVPAAKFAGLAASPLLPFGAIPQRLEGKELKLTRHNGRAGKNGTYNPKHNDRRFDVEHSEHINPEMTRKNIYWDCYTGIKSVAFWENPGEEDFSFEEIEKLYYVEHYGDYVDKVYVKLQGHWIIEMSEMLATSNAKSIEEIRSFISRQKETYRTPYDTYPKDRLRQSVFGGSSNTLDFLPLDRAGNRRFLPIMVYPESAEVHILKNEAASREYIIQVWAEAMMIYRSGEYSMKFSKEIQNRLIEVQRDFMPEDTEAGQIQGFLEHYSGNQVCSKQLFKEALGHTFEEPKRWQLHSINEIMNTAVTGWKAFSNPRMFAGYGRQRGWERIPSCNELPDNKDGFVELTEEEVRQLELPKEWIA